MATLVNAYAELHCLSNFSFQRGASHPEELVQRAAELGYQAIAITDECSVAGVVRAYQEAKQHAIKLIVGSEFTTEEGDKFVLLAQNREGYAQLSTLITHARNAAAKGDYYLRRHNVLAAALEDCLLIWLGASDLSLLAEYQASFTQRMYLALELLADADDHAKYQRLTALADQTKLPLVACGDVHMHEPQRQVLQDCLTAVRYGKPVNECGVLLFQNAERHLRPLQRLQRIYPADALQQTLTIAQRCDFSLDELRYEYPQELVPEGHNPSSWLRELTEQGAKQRWPQGTPQKARDTIEHELALIAELNYEPFFLTVHDVVRFARSQGILCQGRGSAANSAVCFALGITEVDPSLMDVLFERFISRERNEPPDIDVDFENARREEVIQYIYRKYGRHRAALAATVITYRSKSALRDMGKALGFSLDMVERLSKSVRWWDKPGQMAESLAAYGFKMDKPQLQRLVELVQAVKGFPRHLSQHVGGFVIAKDQLSRLVPTENAAMPERTVIQWDKDDLESLGLLKVDVLALGMLTAIRKCFALIQQNHGRALTLASIPQDDPATYAMIQKADTVGVFQIESRAQMTMLPRLKPKTYYDLVIEVAIMRPGPIQGDMVHPYLNRRNGKEPIEYPSDAVKHVLARTLGVPIFQEQVMQLSMVAAGFTAGEADQLRRAMAAWKRKGGLEPFRDKLYQGMAERGYSADFAERIFNQIKGFGDYGFPESHAASFALLAYASSWLKCHYPAEFCTALLNSLPMGFYSASQLVQDVRRHNIEVLPPDVHHSEVDSTVPQPNTIRLGLRRVKGLNLDAAEKIVLCRQSGLSTLQQLATSAELQQRDLKALAAANALQSFKGSAHRHKAYWQVSGIEEPSPLLPTPEFNEAQPMLAPPSDVSNTLADYATTGLTVGQHPIELLRPRLDQLKVCRAIDLANRRSGAVAAVAGIITVRQRPGTATGVMFLTLEDETGNTNLIVWPSVAEAQRQAILAASIVIVRGIVQYEDNVLHLVAGRFTACDDWLSGLEMRSRDFH